MRCPSSRTSEGRQLALFRGRSHRLDETLFDEAETSGDEADMSEKGEPSVSEAFVCDAVRTPIGRYGGALASLRPDDLGALPMGELMRRHPSLDWECVDDVIYGCANQAGEDNRNVARMSALLAGLPETVPGTTVNRLCGSGMDAVGLAARSIRAGDADLMIAGGVESMSRAPFVLAKAERAFDRGVSMHDTTIGWRFVNPALRERVGTHSMPETADNVAADFGIAREDQDRFALRSQQRWASANAAGRFRDEIAPVSVPRRRAEPIVVDTDEHPRATTLEALAKLSGINGPELERHRRQRLGCQRRRLRADRRLRGRRRPSRAGASGAGRRDGERGRRPAHHGHGAGTRDAARARARRAHARSDGHHRAERGLRRAGARGAARARTRG